MSSSGKTASSRQSPLRFMSIGDSLTANAMDPHFGGGGYQYNKSWQMWAQMLSGGKLRFTGMSALGGTTTAQILAQCLPGVLGAKIKPDYCTVLAGVNDALAQPSHNALLTADLGFANISTMAQTLLGAGITPILCTIPGYGNNGSNTVADPGAPVGILRLNAFIRRLAEQLGCPLCDFFVACADPAIALGSNSATGTWRLNYLNQAASDGVHPGGIGALAMGLELVNALGARPTDPTLLGEYYNAGQFNNLLANPLMQTNAAPGPQPDGWTIGTAGTGLTNSLVIDAAIRGKWWRIQKAGAGSQDTSTIAQTINLTADYPGNTYAPGKIARLQGLLKVNSIGDATSFLEIALFNNNSVNMFDPNTVPQSAQQIAAGQATTLQPQFHLQRDADGGAIGPNTPTGGVAVQGPFIAEAVLPAGLGGAPFLMLRVQAAGQALDVQLAELSLQLFNADGTP